VYRAEAFHGSGGARRGRLRGEDRAPGAYGAGAEGVVVGHRLEHCELDAAAGRMLHARGTGSLHTTGRDEGTTDCVDVGGASWRRSGDTCMHHQLQDYGEGYRVGRG